MFFSVLVCCLLARSLASTDVEITFDDGGQETRHQSMEPSQNFRVKRSDLAKGSSSGSSGGKSSSSTSSNDLHSFLKELINKINNHMTDNNWHSSDDDSHVFVVNNDGRDKLTILHKNYTAASRTNSKTGTTNSGGTGGNTGKTGQDSYKSDSSTGGAGTTYKTYKTTTDNGSDNGRSGAGTGKNTGSTTKTTTTSGETGSGKNSPRKGDETVTTQTETKKSPRQGATGNTDNGNSDKGAIGYKNQGTTGNTGKETTGKYKDTNGKQVTGTTGNSDKDTTGTVYNKFGESGQGGYDNTGIGGYVRYVNGNPSDNGNTGRGQIRSSNSNPNYGQQSSNWPWNVSNNIKVIIRPYEDGECTCELQRGE